jgi:DNA polymerase-4
MSSSARRIAHLDMDAFYASVELLRYPDLRGQAVVIGGGRNAVPEVLPDGTRRYARLRDYAGRGVVTTSTYEARALGVFSAMGMMKAAKLAPDAILLPTDFDAYRRYSGLFKAAVRSFTEQIEDRGIDEIYIDLTDIDGEARDVAARIKAAVNAATGLTCSICVAPNKLLAKIGSELDKPDGLTILTPADIPTRIWPLAAARSMASAPRRRRSWRLSASRPWGNWRRPTPRCCRPISAAITQAGWPKWRTGATSGRSWSAPNPSR